MNAADVRTYVKNILTKSFSNKDTIDKLSESADGNLLFNGNEIKGGGDGSSSNDYSSSEKKIGIWLNDDSIYRIVIPNLKAERTTILEYDDFLPGRYIVSDSTSDLGGAGSNHVYLYSVLPSAEINITSQIAGAAQIQYLFLDGDKRAIAGAFEYGSYDIKTYKTVSPNNAAYLYVDSSLSYVPTVSYASSPLFDVSDLNIGFVLKCDYYSDNGFVVHGEIIDNNIYIESKYNDSVQYAIIEYTKNPNA